MPAAPGDERRSERFSMNAQVALRRTGGHNFRVRVYDASCNGCRIEFVERPTLEERVWVKFEGLEAIEGLICWIDGFMAGVDFVRPVNSAVFDALVLRLR